MPKTVVIPRHIEFAKENYLNMTAADIDKKLFTTIKITHVIKTL